MCAGGLNLSSLCRLRAVSFWCVEPTLLLLPEHCRLSVKVESMESAKLGAWKSVRRHLSCFHLMPKGGLTVGAAVTAMDQLPTVLLEEGPPIQEVHLSMKSIGSGEEALHLGAALAGVQCLRLVTEEGMHLMVAPAAAWQFCILDAGKELAWNLRKDRLISRGRIFLAS
jgi:hypothetical protein